jgi:hypothetical protein
MQINFLPKNVTIFKRSSDAEVCDRHTHSQPHRERVVKSFRQKIMKDRNKYKEGQSEEYRVIRNDCRGFNNL